MRYMLKGPTKASDQLACLVRYYAHHTSEEVCPEWRIQRKILWTEVKEAGR